MIEYSVNKGKNPIELVQKIIFIRLCEKSIMSFCLGRLHAFVSIFLILFDSFSGLDNKSSLFAYFVLIRGTILMQEIHKFAAAA